MGLSVATLATMRDPSTQERRANIVRDLSIHVTIARFNSVDNHPGATRHTGCIGSNSDAATNEAGINGNDENGRRLEVEPTAVERGKGEMVTRESEMVRLSKAG
jgi:hypothetical protein